MRERERIINKIYDQIMFVDSRIEKLTQMRDLEIHEMADLERYSNTLANLTLSLINLQSHDDLLSGEGAYG